MFARLGKILLWTVIALVVIVLVLGGALLTAPVQTALARRVLKSVAGNLNGQVSVGKVHVLPSGHALICNVDLRDSSGARVLHVDTIAIRVSFPSLLHDSVHVRELRIAGLGCALRFDSTGRSNLESAIASKKTALSAQTTKEPNRWVIRLDTMIVRGDTARVQLANGAVYQTPNWIANARALYGHDTLNHAFSLYSPQQISLSTAGLTALGDVTKPVWGEVSFSLDSNLAVLLPPPVSTVGNVQVDVRFRTSKDSLKFAADIKSTTLGSLHTNAGVPYPLKEIAGSGDFTLVNVKPSPLLKEKTLLEINGQLHVEKTVAVSLLDGWHVTGNLRDCRYDRYRLTEGILDAHTKDSTAVLEGFFAGAWGSAALSAALHGYDLQRASASGYAKFDKLRIASFVPGPLDSLAPLSGELHVFAPSLNTQHPRASLMLDLGPTGYGIYGVDTISLRAQINDRHFAVDSVYLQKANTKLMARAEGVLGDSLSFAVRGQIPNLHEWQIALGRALPKLDSLWGAVNLNLSGQASLTNNRAHDIMASGTVAVDSAGYGSLTLDHAELAVAHLNVDSMLADGNFDLRGLRGYGQHLDSLHLLGALTPRSFAGGLHLWAKSDTIELATKLNADYNPQRTHVTLDDFKARAYDIEWVADGQTAVTLMGSRFDVDALTLRSDVGVLRASGTLVKGGQQDFVIELSGMRTEEIGRIFKKPVPASITDLRLELAGPDTALTGELTVTADSVRLDGTSIADEIALHAAATSSGTHVDGMVRWLGDTLTVFDGELPAKLSFDKGLVLRKDQPMQGHVRLLRQSLNKLDRYMPFGTTLGGTLSGDVTFSGTPDVPRWGGSFQIVDGKYFDSRFGVRYDKIHLTGELAGDTLRIPEFSLRSNGTLSGTGWGVMAFPLPAEVHLNVKSDRFDVVDAPAMRVRASGTLTVNGPPKRLNADGNLQLSNVQYRITQSTSKQIEDIDLPTELARLRGQQVQKSPFSPSQLYNGMSHSFMLDLPGNCWLSGSGLNLELSGKLYLNKEADEPPQVIGDINVVQGTVQFLRDQFRVSDQVTSKVTFDGPANDPVLDVTAFHSRWKAQGYDITLHLTGRASAAKAEVSGTDPANRTMTQEEVVMLLLFGRVAQSGVSAGATGEVQAAVETMASSGLSNLVSKWSGVDMFQYDPGTGGLSNLTSGSLEVGSYVTDRLFVKVRQPIEVSQLGQEVTVEYRLLNWLKLQARQTGTQSSAFDLLLQIDWR